MNYLVPSILAADFCNMGAQLDIIENYDVKCLHIDVMDGMFVPSISFGMPVLKCVRAYTKLFLDVHLMVQDPERYIEEFIKLGADSVTIHVEACKCVDGTLNRIKELGARCGIAISPETPVKEVVPYIEKVDMVLVMTVRPGFGGQKYMTECADKIRQVRRIIEERGLDTAVEIDGGVCRNNLKENLDAGANVIVSGSSIFKGDIADNVQYFLNVMKENR